MITVDQIITTVMQSEGGFVDDPADPGGATNYGVTLAMLSKTRKTTCSVDDVRNLKSPEARAILTNYFVYDPGFNKIEDDFIRLLLVDSAVNHGPSHPIQWVQKILGLVVDGTFGSSTIAAVNLYPQMGGLAAKFLAARTRFYGRDITNNPSQAKFAAGWTDRIATFIEQLT